MTLQRSENKRERDREEEREREIERHRERDKERERGGKTTYLIEKSSEDLPLKINLSNVFFFTTAVPMSVVCFLLWLPQLQQGNMTAAEVR